MIENEYLSLVKEAVYPDLYPQLVYSGDTEFLARDGSYLFYCLPASMIDFSDVKNKAIKHRVREKIFAMPVLMEKGLFVHAFGDRKIWEVESRNLKVDKTALRPIILQNINFIDPASGASFNNRTSWGSLEFGFCGNVIKVLEALGKKIQQEKDN